MATDPLARLDAFLLANGLVLRGGQLLRTSGKWGDPPLKMQLTLALAPYLPDVTAPPLIVRPHGRVRTYRRKPDAQPAPAPRPALSWMTPIKGK